VAVLVNTLRVDTVGQPVPAVIVHESSPFIR
jgi:hypothetical protein